MAESFSSHLETEGIYPHPLESKSVTRIRVVDYIESFYNSKRLHSGLGYVAPFEFLGNYYENQSEEAAQRSAPPSINVSGIGIPGHSGCVCPAQPRRPVAGDPATGPPLSGHEESAQNHDHVTNGEATV